MRPWGDLRPVWGVVVVATLLGVTTSSVALAASNTWGDSSTFLNAADDTLPPRQLWQTLFDSIITDENVVDGVQSDSVWTQAMKAKEAGASMFSNGTICVHTVQELRLLCANESIGHLAASLGGDRSPSNAYTLTDFFRAQCYWKTGSDCPSTSKVIRQAGSVVLHVLGSLMLVWIVYAHVVSRLIAVAVTHPSTVAVVLRRTIIFPCLSLIHI